MYFCPVCSEKLGKLQRSLTEKRNEIIELTDKLLPNLLHEVAELQSARILQGDYNLKIARQDYFTSKQDEVRKVNIGRVV